jgi:hypothetical protein
MILTIPVPDPQDLYLRTALLYLDMKMVFHVVKPLLPEGVTKFRMSSKTGVVKLFALEAGDEWDGPCPADQQQFEILSGPNKGLIWNSA